MEDFKMQALLAVVGALVSVVGIVWRVVAKLASRVGDRTVAFLDKLEGRMEQAEKSAASRHQSTIQAVYGSAAKTEASLREEHRETRRVCRSDTEDVMIDPPFEGGSPR